MTLVIAHRTCPRNTRENSLDGIELAARLGADVVEVDARRSRDGTAVLLHDVWLGRVQHVPWPLRWANDRLLAKLGVPTLTAALERARAAGLRVAIDAKDAGATAAVLTAVREMDALDQVSLWSEHLSTLQAFAHAQPEVEVVLFRDTFDDVAHDQFLTDAAAVGARSVSAHQDAVTPAFVASARDRGLTVYCGYQSLATQTARLLEVARAGLAGVVTDWPAQARSSC